MDGQIMDCALPRVRIGVSACLLGQRVRFDGGHKRHGFLTGPLADCVDLVPVCPEAGSGMGVPRPPIRLVGDPARSRAVGVEDPTLDVTERLLSFARRQVADLGAISGYVLKQNSPSCGRERVKVHSPRGTGIERQEDVAKRIGKSPFSDSASQKPTDGLLRQPHQGRGLFARVLMTERPLLPVVEEVGLHTPTLREGFLTRVLVYHRWQELTAVGITAERLIRFHADHEHLVMARSPTVWGRMGRMLATLGEEADLNAVAHSYARALMAALEHHTDRADRADETQRLRDNCGPKMEDADQAAQAEPVIRAIAAYRRGALPLAVPLARLRHYLQDHPDSRLRNTDWS
ncbi:MAG: DUF523 and DUF1722 domain-containing protein [Candidatus Thiosymbion ectosymbiont of Robbea hypermnestra]|nr:DUF523 and DUF1722 domain-containing protein [Candidatus Thiosymbion ectosymbiont of Robbea hypermnestra]